MIVRGGAHARGRAPAHAGFALQYLRLAEHPTRISLTTLLTVTPYWPPFFPMTSVLVTAILGFSVPAVAADRADAGLSDDLREGAHGPDRLRADGDGRARPVAARRQRCRACGAASGATFAVVALPWYVKSFEAFREHAAIALGSDPVREGDPTRLLDSIHWYWVAGVGLCAIRRRPSFGLGVVAAWVVPALAFFLLIPKEDGRFDRRRRCGPVRRGRSVRRRSRPGCGAPTSVRISCDGEPGRCPTDSRRR